MFSAFRIPISYGELLKRTIKEINADNVLGLAAQLAYYFILALVPAIIALVAIATFFPPNLIQDALSKAAGVLPGDVFSVLQRQVASLAGQRDAGLLTFGFLLALWSSSSAMVSITDAMNRVYDIEEGRPWWRVRLTAILLTIALAVFVLLSIFLVMVGPTFAEWLASQFGLGSAFELAWKILQWPVVLLLITVAIGLVFYFAPDAEQDWVWVTPGSFVATILWLLASLGFKLYLANFADYNATYGSLAGAVVLLLWFYISALAVLVGAEMNAEIEHASPYGKDVGEKVPGEKRKLGAAAARDYEKKQAAAREQKQAAGEPARGPSPAPFRPADDRGWSFAPGAMVYLLVRFFRRERGERGVRS